MIPWLDKTEFLKAYELPMLQNDEQLASHFTDLGWSVSRRAITDARNSHGLPPKTKAQLFSIEQDEYDAVKMDAAKVWDLVIEMQSELRKRNTARKDINVTIHENKPIGIAMMGDLHIGDLGTDHAALKRDAELIKQTEGLYVTMGGDYINNFVKGGKKIANNEAVPVEVAWQLTEDLFETLNSQLIAILLGNHDAWTEQAAELDPIAKMIERLGAPYGKHATTLKIEFPDGQAYKIRMRHKYRFESSLNLLNAVKQMFRHDSGGPFDVGVLHHLHQPGAEAFMQPPMGQCWAIRPGSYKVEDDYAVEHGFTSTGMGQSRRFGTDDSCQYTIPVLILFPGERRMNVFTTIKDGVDYLNYIRKEQ